MIQPPVLVGLRLCHEVITEEHTKRVTLVNCFRRLWVQSFPSPKQEFKIALALTDGMGPTEMTLGIKRLSASWEDIFQRSWEYNFTDPLPELWFFLTIRCSFPVAGLYQVGLLAGGQGIGQAVLTVQSKGDKHE